MICPKCNSEKVNKNGKYKIYQKFKCVNCNHQFKETTKIPEDIKQKAVVLYNLGFSIPKIAHQLETSSVNVLNWLRKEEKVEEMGIVCEPVRDGDSEGLVFEIDI